MFCYSCNANINMSIVCRRVSLVFNEECHTQHIRVVTGFFKVSGVSEAMHAKK